MPVKTFASKIAASTMVLAAVLVTVGSQAAVIPVSNSAALQSAINSAHEGDVIELAAGSYTAPNGGFTLYNPTAGFTIRAAAGAAVNLNGNGTTIDSNDDWKTNQAAIAATGLQPAKDAESAILVSNPAPGGYTAILRGKTGGIGVGVVEVYVF